MVGSELFPDLRITGKQEGMGNGLTTSCCSVGNDPNCTIAETLICFTIH